jgi:Fe-Mn family superoxide dismutase
MHELPALPYAPEALEPWYDAQTVRLHHGAHHRAYVTGLNNAEVKLAEARARGDLGLVKHWSRELAFHGCGHMLHSIFWTNMKPGGGGLPTGELARQIDKDFGSFDAYRAQFLAAGDTVEGSGWGLLVRNRELGRLEILACEKHQNQAWWQSTVLLALDVWEHAYYLKYQNKRPDWTRAFLDHLVSWDDVAARLAAAR